MSASSPDDLPVARRVLVVMRHGKAEPYGDDDQGRRLTSRGEQEAASAGRWLASQDLLPDHALVSSAARTRGTWEALAAASGCTLAPEYSDDVYAAHTDTAIDLLRTVPTDASVVLYVGHNPTVASLAHLLDAGDPDPVAFRMVTEGFPTAAIAVLEVPVPWSELDAGSARLVAGYAGRG